MAIPSVGGGYQIGDGNINETPLGIQPAPQTATVTATLTAAQITGGMIVAALTDIPGSSSVVDRGFVTYSNDAKIDLLGVDADLVNRHGAVSEPVAAAMAKSTPFDSTAPFATSGVMSAPPVTAQPERTQFFPLIPSTRISRCS